MKLDCYALHHSPPVLTSARPGRAWMDDFPDRHAYRCLPLCIANAHGWEIQSPHDFEIRWNGGPDARDISFHALDGFPWLSRFVDSNFTRGVVTFHTGYLFRTEPHWNLLATGPLNMPKDGISPLSGVIETDWLPYPFTMNWQLTRAGTVRWSKGEPFCMIFPVQRASLKQFTPNICNIEDDPDLNAQLQRWRSHREEFLAKLRDGDAETRQQGWQRYYFLGTMPDSGEEIAGHSTRLRLNDPTDRRGRPDEPK